MDSALRSRKSSDEMSRLSLARLSICALRLAKSLNRLKCVSMKQDKRDVELIEVILSVCEILAKRINRFDDTEALSLVI